MPAPSSPSGSRPAGTTTVPESGEDLGLYARSACAAAAAELGCADLEVQGGTENHRVPVSAGQPVWVFVDG